MNEGIGFILTVLIACGSALGSYHISCQHEEKMASLGYIEVQAIGTTDTLWIKP